MDADSLKELYDKFTSENIGTHIYTSEQLNNTNYNGVWLDADMQPPLNVESKGDQSLTAEQIKSLQNKYDVTNLSPQEEYKLFQELTDLGVITKEEAMNSQMAIDIVPLGITIKSGELWFTGDVKQSNLLERLGTILHDEIFLYNKAEEEYGKTYDEALPLIGSHQKLYDILRQLERSPISE